MDQHKEVTEKKYGFLFSFSGECVVCTTNLNDTSDVWFEIIQEVFAVDYDYIRSAVDVEF